MLASVCQAYVFRKAQDLASLVPLGAAIRLVKGGMNCSGRSGVSVNRCAHSSDPIMRVNLRSQTSYWYVPYINLQNSGFLFPPGLGGSGFDLLHLDPRALDLFDDVLNRGGPDERLGVFVPGLHKCLDRLL